MRLNFAILSSSTQKAMGQEGTGGTACIHAASTCPTLTAMTGDTVGQPPAVKAETRTDSPEMSHLSHRMQNEVGRGKPSIHADVPHVPPVPPKNHTTGIDREAFEEQAADLEFEDAPVQVDPFIERRDQLRYAGLNQDEAALMAWKLEQRDFERDDRRLCIECQHLSGGAGNFRCAQWRMHQLISSDIPNDLVTTILHRCGEFDPILQQGD